MELFKKLLPGVKEGDIKLFLPFIIMLVLLLIVCYISKTQNNRMPNSICLLLMVCGISLGIMNLSYLGILDMIIGFFLSCVTVITLYNILSLFEVNLNAANVKYFTVLGLYFGIYNVINVLLFCFIMFFVIIWTVKYSDEKSASTAPYMTLSSLILAVLIILMQHNVGPFAGTFVNLYPVF